MTEATLPQGAPPAPGQTRLVFSLGAALSVLVALILVSRLVPGAAEYPAAAVLPAAEWIGAFFQALKTAISGFTRGLATAMAVPLDLATGLLAKGLKLPVGADTLALPRLSWLGIILAAAIIGHALGGMRMALIGGLGFLYIAVFRQWDSAMLTLALIVVCVPLCVVLGMVVGIWGHASPRADRLVITPALDLMQTIPTFAYLIPMLLLFGISPVSALLATGLFATPPMVRATMLGLRKVKPEIRDFADMAGCTASQKLWRVLIPSAKPSLMIGVNQVIMLALNMVIISSMIGAGGLGYDVLLALRRLAVGQAMEAGLAIVVVAIVLDRMSQAAAAEARSSGAARSPGLHLMLAAAAIIATTLISLGWPALAKVPSAMTLSTAPWWKAVIDWITVNYFDALEIFRTGFLLNVLNPLRALFEGLPWFAVTGMLAYAGWQLGNWRLALLVAALTAFCAATGLWVQTMATVYLCGVAALIAAIIGIPIGVLAAKNDRFAGVILPIIDTLQTIPSFCFIIPVVMLFRVGDVTAVIATVAFAIVPAIRYTDHGLRQVPQELIEAGRVSGCTRSQLFFRVELPVALPEILLGINQTILMSLSMIIICAMIGTRDLGQEVFKALAKADAGKGVVAGLCIAFIGMVADRLITAWAARLRGATPAT
jgi:glycine betaine/proline transport system permease protein